MRHGFEVLKLDRILAGVDLPNERSHRLMARLGFTPTGETPTARSTGPGPTRRAGPQPSGLVHQFEAMLRSERRSISVLARSRSAETTTICTPPCSWIRVVAWDSPASPTLSQRCGSATQKSSISQVCCPDRRPAGWGTCGRSGKPSSVLPSIATRKNVAVSYQQPHEERLG